jgi:hypothetical protein
LAKIMGKCKDCHCDCHCSEALHGHHYDGDLCGCDKCKCNKRTYKKLKDHGLDISFENEAKYD